VSRDEWDRADVCGYFELEEEEASGLLDSLGFDPIDPVGKRRWRVSKDPARRALLDRIRYDFLHYARPEEFDPPDEGPGR
jgi:hypothetical protein